MPLKIYFVKLEQSLESYHEIPLRSSPQSKPIPAKIDKGKKNGQIKSSELQPFQIASPSPTEQCCSKKTGRSKPEIPDKEGFTTVKRKQGCENCTAAKLHINSPHHTVEGSSNPKHGQQVSTTTRTPAKANVVTRPN
jgi:hypothetical protein